MRFAKFERPAIFRLGLLLVVLLPTFAKAYEPREGDIAFQSLARNPLIDAIEGATESPYSHCGILQFDGREWLVVEAIGPVKKTPFETWKAQGRDGRFAVYRLDEKYRDRIPKFLAAAQGYLGRPYDIHYDPDDAAIYCSELIFKSFRQATDEELGKLQTLGELKWQPHAAVIKAIEGGTVPLERKMITPRSLSEARQLKKIVDYAPLPSAPEK